jgi:hypothetical protein
MTFWCIEKIGSMTSIVYERTYVKIYTVYFVNSQLMYQFSATGTKIDPSYQGLHVCTKDSVRTNGIVIQ